MIEGKMMSRTANPVPCPKFAATSRAMNTHRTKIAIISSQPMNGIHVNRLHTNMIQNQLTGRFDILTTLYSL